MPFLKEIYHNNNRIAIWQIDEPEDELLQELVEIPDLPTNPRRRLERLATLNLLKHLDLGGKYHYQPDGSPYLPENNTNISISHAGNKVVLAVNPVNPVGVDIEQIHRDYTKVASKYMTLREICHINSYGQAELSLIWCIKEAVYKLPWGASKCFSTEIDVLVEVDMFQRGWCTVKVKHNDDWCNYRAYFEYIDDFCLAWVNL